MKHIVMYSGGIGSWAAAKRVVAQYGTDDLVLLFTDTLVEDRDLYRFLIETAAEIYGTDRPTDLIAKTAEIPDIISEADVESRKRLLPRLAAETMRLLPGLMWIADGRAPWDVFKDVKYIGNSRLAQCSHVLKQEMARKWIEANYGSADCTLYLGIDWTESHRKKAPIENWAPYSVKFPMCDEPLIDKDGMLQALDGVGIIRPRLYGMGFSHNNCSAACVRAGQGHWAKVYEVMPDQFRYQERKEQEMREYLGKDVTVLKREGPRVNGKRTSVPLTFTQLRERIERAGEIDREDIGGCGCFVSYDEKETV
ncbi:hypothetical protein [Paenibacillus naphthalenovorans]|uniref:hypothetical protein n=1 Tax=Paenibacillus naphthalenovorans TaxID=162209 RepID=UPI003D2C2C5C